MKKRFLVIMTSLLLLFLVFNGSVQASPDKLVYVIPLEDTIDLGLSRFVERSYQEAEKLGADLVVLEMDTPGGRVDAAQQIKTTIQKSSISTVTLVKGRAISAGALIAIASDTIAMQPGSTIGDAEPRLGTERADEKYVSAWAKEMAGTAEAKGRDPQIAIAMVDRDAEIPGLVEKGKLLTLTYQEAKEHGYNDYTVQGRAELLKELGLEEAQVVEARLSIAERITRFITNPFVAPILLTVGIAGIIIELLTVGWGLAGGIGLVSLVLYFGGHLLAGFTGWEAVLLFLLGLILLVVEALAPGFGLPGIGGIICIIISIVLSAPNWEIGIRSLVFALLGTIILVLFSFKLLTKRKFWNRLVLGEKLTKEEGYVPQNKDLSRFIGQEGTALTILRPAGTVVLEDGTRLDVVTEGEFIPKGKKVVVSRLEGLRIVVHAKNEKDKEE